MTSVVFYHFSAEIMQLYLIQFHSVCGMLKNTESKCVYLYVLYILYIHCMLSLASSLHDKCSDFDLCSHAWALYFKTTVISFISDKKWYCLYFCLDFLVWFTVCWNVGICR